MLAHQRPIRAATLKVDLARHRKHATARLADTLHHRAGEFSLQQFNDAVDRTRTRFANALPLLFRQRGHADHDFVQRAPHHLCLHLTGRHAQIDDRSVADIAAPTRQATGKIAVMFHIIAPGLAPERLRDCTATGDDRRQQRAALVQPGNRGFSFFLARSDRLIGFSTPETHCSFPLIFNIPALREYRA